MRFFQHNQITHNTLFNFNSSLYKHMASSRNPNYTTDEDKHLCRCYLEISQDPVTGIYQKSTQLWIRITELYNSEKPSSNMADRSSRSLETRMQSITSSVKFFKCCIQHIEALNPSGASEHDILTRAKQMMADDDKFPKGFKFEHVWPIMKDFAKFDCNPQSSRKQRSSFRSDTSPESPISPDGLPSSFSINLSDGSGSGSGPSQRPDGVKKTKNKRKNHEDMSGVLKAIEQGNKRIGELMENSSTRRENLMLLQMQKIEAKNKATEAKNRALAFQRWESDNKILMIDTDNISDPIRRNYFKNEQEKIIMKREVQSSIGGDFPDLGGSGSDFGGSGSDFGGSDSGFGAY